MKTPPPPHVVNTLRAVLSLAREYLQNAGAYTGAIQELIDNCTSIAAGDQDQAAPLPSSAEQQLTTRISRSGSSPHVYASTMRSLAANLQDAARAGLTETTYHFKSPAEAATVRRYINQELEALGYATELKNRHLHISWHARPAVVDEAPSAA